jgi:hypothetical protein
MLMVAVLSQAECGNTLLDAPASSGKGMTWEHLLGVGYDRID